MSAQTNSLALNIYGASIRIESDDNAVLDKLDLDFSYFVSDDVPGAPSLSLALHNSAPPFSSMPALKASFYNNDSISYDSGNIRYVDYHGKALTVFDYSNGTGRIYSRSERAHV